jgi:hypothetical protein
MLDHRKMQKTAPTYATSAAIGSCPDDEELSAYIDGNVDKAERERITAHLATCEDCYARFVDTAHFLLDSSPLMPEDLDLDKRLVEFPVDRGRLVAQWGSVAALLMIGAGTGVYFLKSPPSLPTGSMTASIPPSSDARQFWLGPTTRGGGEGGDEQEARPPDETAARLGVQLVNLQVGLRAGKVGESQDVIARILGLLKGQLFTDDLQKGYTAITVALANGKSPAEILAEATQLARETREAVDPTSLDLGQWVEAGRLAALAQNPSFFQQSETRSFLRRLLWRDRLGIEKEFKLDPPTREALQKISDVLSKGDLQAPDYAEIRRQTEKILEIHYPEA